MWICAAGDLARGRVDVVDFTNISLFYVRVYTACEKLLQ
jgi:hypothetical protein